MRHDAALWLGVTGLMLMPFSTGVEDGGVLAFGLPLIALALLITPEVALGAILGGSPARTRLLIAAGFCAALAVPFALLSPMPAQSVWRAAVFVLGYAFALWMLGMSSDPRSALTICRAYTAFGLLLAAYYALHFAWQAAALGIEAVALERYVGGTASLPWGASNVIAGVILLTLIAHLAMRRTDDLRWWENAFPFVALLGIAMTFSRAALLLALAALFLLSGSSRYKRTIMIFAGGVAVAAAAAYWMIAIDAGVAEQLLADRLETESLETVGGRLALWADRLQYLPGALLVPHGYYSSIFVFDGVSPHSFLLTTLIEQGLLGAIAYTAMFTLLFSYLRGSLRWGWVLVLAHLCVEDLNFTQPYAMGFWSLFALSILARHAAVRPAGGGASARALTSPAPVAR